MSTREADFWQPAIFFAVYYNTCMKTEGLSNEHWFFYSSSLGQQPLHLHRMTYKFPIDAFVSPGRMIDDIILFAIARDSGEQRSLKGCGSSVDPLGGTVACTEPCDCSHWSVLHVVSGLTDFLGARDRWLARLWSPSGRVSTFSFLKAFTLESCFPSDEKLVLSWQSRNSRSILSALSVRWESSFACVQHQTCMWAKAFLTHGNNIPSSVQVSHWSPVFQLFSHHTWWCLKEHF